MQRFCDTCRRERPIRDFDLDGDRRQATCLSCAAEPARANDQRARGQLTALEHRRRSLIAALVKIDAEIAAIRDGLHSASFKRVDPADVLDSADGLGD